MGLLCVNVVCVWCGSGVCECGVCGVGLVCVNVVCVWCACECGVGLVCVNVVCVVWVWCV